MESGWLLLPHLFDVKPHQDSLLRNSRTSQPSTDYLTILRGNRASSCSNVLVQASSGQLTFVLLLSSMLGSPLKISCGNNFSLFKLTVSQINNLAARPLPTQNLCTTASDPPLLCRKPPGPCKTLSGSCKTTLDNNSSDIHINLVKPSPLSNLHKPGPEPFSDHTPNYFQFWRGRVRCKWSVSLDIMLDVCCKHSATSS